MQVGEAGGRRVAAAFVAGLIALACVLILPAVAAAEEFTVNSAAEEKDAAPGVGGCQSAAGNCTLRAAIEEANGSVGEFDTLSFSEDPFDGQAAGTVHLTSSLEITDFLLIDGQCSDSAEVIRPCVGIDGPGPGKPAILVSNAAETEIEGVAVTGAEIGIRVDGSGSVKVFGSWLGVTLDGGLDGNETGVLLLESNNARIGGEGPERRNVFAGSSGDGLRILGASNVRVLGNYFGVEPDGTTPAPNAGEGIVVASKSTGSGVVEATGNTIGTQLSPVWAASPACDGGCNVISGSGLSAIDLEGDPSAEELPAASTTIFSNYIGLDASGTGAVPNGGDGVHVGQAGRTVIGGPRLSEANRVVGGESAVVAGPASNNLVVRGNSVGVDFNGVGLVAPDAGIVVNSEGLSGPTAEAVVVGNALRMEGGVGISQAGLAGWISSNRISGAGTGIRVDGFGEQGLGNLIQDNLIEASTTNGILIESSSNEVFGNEVVNSGGAGVRIAGVTLSPQFGVSGNLIGGDVERDENLIAASGGAAVEISNPEEATNEVARNRGFANNGLFIDLDLVPFPGDKNTGTNGGIQPPKFFAATAAEVRGGFAEPDATVRLFRKAGAEAGEIASFLGEAIADEEGEWKIAYPAIPAGTIVAATQTSAVGGTSELVMATTPAAPGAGPACALSGGCDAPRPSVPPAPETKIFKGPKGKRLVGVTAAFKFKASVDGSTFQCRLDGKQFGKCHSPKVYTGLKPGKHRFEVRAIGSAGQVDPSPAKLKFTVID